ncbi:dnaK protein [Histomonas meleagridis]|uniref:dnaK protein n=1 Tax=Histomonas meleagridis TaxID=135588 RepID=UPI00355A6526|nr:dnaK protein [Histomonas meleagridis]KAH0804652.1 dnaK protein [Histomonas meleagridis]
MLFIVYAIFTVSTIYGVDIGSEKIKVGMATKDGEIGIQPSHINKRYTQNILSYGLKDSEVDPLNNKWYVDSEAIVISSQNNSRSVKNPFNYLTNPKEFPFPHIHPVAASAIVLGSLVPSFIPKTDTIISVIPTSSTPQFRSALYEALQLTNVKSPVLLDHNTAIATFYATEKINRTMRGSSDIMFIDIGALQTEISHWRFSVKNSVVNVELIHFNYSHKICGNSIDKLLLEYAVQKIGKSPSEIDLDELERQMKKAKEEFHFKETVTVNLTKKFNVLFNITLDEIKEITKPMFNELLALLKTFKTPDSIELVGGATRFPLFNTTIFEFYENIPVYRSMNIDEAAVLGALYHEALRSKIISGIKLNVTKPSLFGYSVRKSQKELKLLEQNSKFAKRIITLLEKDDFKFSLRASNLDYIDYDVTGLTQISHANKGKLRNETFVSNATFDYIPSIDSYGLVNIKATNFVGDREKIWTLQVEEIPTKEEMRVPHKAGRVVSTALSKIKESRKNPSLANRLQVLVFTTLDKLLYDPYMEMVTTPEERDSLVSFLEEVKLNMTSETNVRAYRDLISRTELRLRGPILRANELEDRQLAIETLQAAIEKAEEMLPKATTDEAAIKSFRDFYNFTKIWCEASASQNSEPLSNPIILSKDIYRRANKLVARIPELFARKRHVPHFRTAPPEPPQAQKKDTEKLNKTDENKENQEL